MRTNSCCDDDQFPGLQVATGTAISAPMSDGGVSADIRAEPGVGCTQCGPTPGQAHLTHSLHRARDHSRVTVPHHGTLSLRDCLTSHLLTILPLYSPSYEETAMATYVSRYLRASGWSVAQDGMGNVMAARGTRPGGGYILLNAHLDTCQSDGDRDLQGHLRYDASRGLLLAETPHGKRYQVGADDKAGIGTILALAQGTDLPFKVLFSVREECGQEGVQAVSPDFYADCAFCLTLDRKGRGDIISTYCGRTCAPAHAVENIVTLGREEGMDYWRTSAGSIADTYHIADYIPAVNLSVGYYNPHSSSDYIKVDETYGTLRLVKRCIEHPERLPDSSGSRR